MKTPQMIAADEERSDLLIRRDETGMFPENNGHSGSE